ncbi:hypothetical protein KIN20_030809 [Parelaphostrongylus tenuis]|uniref:Golgin subfamily A conserved domain-containing protein n=1 Tax=Parelaphostrongylus tenuis TaxID=148309 RepID=A0AAD5R4J1_PARTN|nr:hypothetical protein KIN20_030809 [Parelaphostrongylus tenuis]
MSESLNRADKLAIAKKKLKEFEARRQQREYDSSPVPSVASTAGQNPNSGRLSVNSNHSCGASNSGGHPMYCSVSIENGIGEQSFQQSRNVMEDYATNRSSPAFSAGNPPTKNLALDPNGSNNSSPSPHMSANTNEASASTCPFCSNISHHGNNFDMERNQLLHERKAAVDAYEQVSEQLEQLWSSCGCRQANSAASICIGCPCEEKTSVQSELRNTRNELEQERILNETLSANVKSLRVDESKKHQKQLMECEHLLSARSAELDDLRKSEANAQARLLAVQQERSEAQARLKAVAREKEDVASELKQVRKELHMKEIHLKQLVPHGFVNNASSENTISTLNDRVDALQSQVGVLTRERDKLLLSNEELSRHYEICRLEFVNAREKLANELLVAISARDAALSHIKELQDDVCVLQKELYVNRSTSAPTSAEVCKATAGHCTDEDVNRKVLEAVKKADAEWQKKFDEEGQLVDTMIKEKDQVIFEREQKLSELEMRLRLTEERLGEVRTNSSDMLSLSEQLQNEKATVSRAVAQNRELKEQLIETENRFMALTEEKLQSELARQAAEHQVKELLVLLDSKNQTEDGAPYSNSTGAVLESVLHPAMSLEPSITSKDWDMSERGTSESVTEASRNREHILETRLEMANQELEEIRADLRRSHTRNEEMNQILRQNAEDENQNSIHVELGQAVARIHELASENQQLRESIERMVEDRSRLENSLAERPKAFDVSNSQSTKSENCTSSTHLVNSQLCSIGGEKWAQSELEKRFALAMRNNAELHDKLDALEHINLQLQLENDTIADHVVLYQHQRRLIRERLRVKDEQLAAMEADKAETMKRCQELHKALMDVLVRTGALKEYEVCDRTHSNLSQLPKRRVGRSYSHSTVDELSGDEDVIVNGSNIEVPLKSKVNSTDENTLSEDGRSRPASPLQRYPKSVRKSRQSVSSSPSVTETDAAVHKILQMITEISKPSHPSSADRLHCTQCIGSLQTL